MRHVRLRGTSPVIAAKQTAPVFSICFPNYGYVPCQGTCLEVSINAGHAVASNFPTCPVPQTLAVFSDDAIKNRATPIRSPPVTITTPLKSCKPRKDPLFALRMAPCMGNPVSALPNVNEYFQGQIFRLVRLRESNDRLECSKPLA